MRRFITAFTRARHSYYQDKVIKIATSLEKSLQYLFSSSSALQLRYSLGFLNNNLPFWAMLDIFCPLNNLHPSHVIHDVTFPSGLGSSWSFSCEWFPFIYFSYNTCFRISVYVSKPTQSLRFNVIYIRKYLGATLTDQNTIQEEIKSRLKLGNACYYSVQNLLSSRLLSRNLNFARCFVWVWNLVADIEGGT
jgi:hypothetical protein